MQSNAGDIILNTSSEVLGKVSGTTITNTDSNGFHPGADNNANGNLGKSSLRWSRIWVSNSINSQAGDLILKTNSSGSVGVELAGSVGTEALEVKEGTTVRWSVDSGGRMSWVPNGGYSAASTSGYLISENGYIRVSVNGTTRYIPLYEAIGP
jgi:hypothetical protein